MLGELEELEGEVELVASARRLILVQRRQMVRARMELYVLQPAQELFLFLPFVQEDFQ